MKDTSTGRKSITTTFVVLSSLQMFVIINLFIYKSFKKEITVEDLGLALFSIVFVGIFSAIYWDKKVRISKEGLDISDESDS